jgi:prepilin-type N-terminal cleavage/methylation domain-containing protein
MKQRGYSLIELLVVCATLGVIMAITIPLLRSAILRAHVGAMAADSKTIHLAFKRYFIDHGEYPNAGSSPAFELNTFEPLIAEKYYDGHVLGKLLGSTADAYDSPDDRGVNQEFWLEMTLQVDPSVRFLVVDSDDAPLSPGVFLDGIYMYRDGVLTPLTLPVK